MPNKCVAANCSNAADPCKRIFIDTTPFFGDSWLKAIIKRRKKWVDFIKAKQAKWKPTKYSHFYAIRKSLWVYFRKFYTGRSRPEVQPLTLLLIILTEKVPVPYTFKLKKVLLSHMFLRTVHRISKPLQWSFWTLVRENIKHNQRRC